MILVAEEYAAGSRKPPASFPETGYWGGMSIVNELDERVRSIRRDIQQPLAIGQWPYGHIECPRSTASPWNPLAIDFAGAESSMRQIASQQGLDFDKLAQEASEHFRNPTVSPYASDLTDEEINLLADDDDQALHR